MTIDWDEFRCNDGTLDLCAALERLLPEAFQGQHTASYRLLDIIQEIHPIRSRQVAAVALAHALALANFVPAA